jgi:uncharacterized protein (TIGR02246 family)
MGKRMIRFAGTFILITLAAGCAQSPVPDPFPQDVADAWAERFAANDAAGVAALYAEDAQLLPPDNEIVSGRAAIREFIAKNNAPGGPKLQIATIETHVFGDYAHRQGGFMFKGPDGAVINTGKFMELWKKVDGKWLIYRDMWSSNTPRSATDAPPDESA